VSTTGRLIRAVTRGVERLGRGRAERWVLAMVRTLAPLLPETRLARRNVALCFPDKSPAEVRAIVRKAWENFAKLIVEFVFLEEISRFDVARREQNYFTIEGGEYFDALRDDGKTAVIFGAHLANWEMVAVAGRLFGLELVLPFRAPVHSTINADILDKRTRLMGQLVRNARGAAFEIADAMERGRHFGMMIDQRLAGGIRVPFFGRPARTNPLPANLARQFDCPVHGAHAIRMPDGRLHLVMTPPIEMPRDAEGLVDVEAATALMTRIVEGWVREHPEQWFWLHDRWR
jgi:KDO2-lipid IV(A) lauroyltransferase